MKRIFIAAVAIIAAVILSAAALCEKDDSKWYISDKDNYFHESRICCGRDDLYSQSGTGKPADRYPCPVCVETKGDAAAPVGYRIGDLVIIRMSDMWMGSLEDEYDGIFADTSARVQPKYEALYSMEKYAHGKAHAILMDAYQSGSEAMVNVYKPSIYPGYAYYYPDDYADDDYPYGLEKDISLRHIGSEWYTVLRSDNHKNDVWKGYMRFFAGPAFTADGYYYEQFEDEWGNTKYTVDLRDISGKKTYSRSEDSQNVDIYTYGKENFCVIRLNGEPEGGFATVLINGRIVMTELEPYEDNGDSVFCFAVSEGEVAKIKAGESVVVIWGTALESDFGAAGTVAAFGKSPIGTWQSYYNIADRSGKVYFEKVVDFIEAYDLYMCCFDKRYNTFDGKSGLAVFDKTFNEKLFIEDYSFYPIRITMNSGFFTAGVYGGSLYIVSTDSCEIITEIKPENDNPDVPLYNNWWRDVNAEYVRESGKPDCMVFGRDGAYWLADERGQRVTGNYEMLDTILWYGDNGLFCVQSGTNKPCEDPDMFFEHGYWGQRYDQWAHYGESMWYENESWLCGIIDANGNVLADTVYRSVRIISDSAVELTDAEGNKMVIDLAHE